MLKSIILACIIAIVPGSAMALDISYADNAFVWPSYSANPNKDVNGIPDLLGGTFTTTDGSLASISMNYTRGGNTNARLWNNLGLGDWFFDTNNDSFWDYAIHNPNANGGNSASTWQIYKLGSLEFSAIANPNWEDVYVSSSDYDTGIPRQDHPVALNGNGTLTYIGDALFDGWDPYSTVAGGGTGESLWSLDYFGDEAIDFGEIVAFSFTPSCGNDVLFGTVNTPFENPLPTPEPATMILIGSGLAGLGLLRRKNA